MAHARQVYELELEREVAARHQYELEVQNRVHAESRSDLEALRAEINGLREVLRQLAGTEVTFERVALTAQSTRMGSLAQSSTTLSAAGDAGQSSLPEGDSPRELISQVLESNAGKPVETPEPASAATAPPAEEADAVREDRPKKTSRRLSYKTLKQPKTAEEPETPEEEPESVETEPETVDVLEDEKPPAADSPEVEEAEPDFPKSDEDDEEPAARLEPLGSVEPTLPAAETKKHGRRRAKGGFDSWTPSWERNEPPKDTEAPAVGDPAGSHRQGRSVSELLAARGTDTPPRHRRRRT